MAATVSAQTPRERYRAQVRAEVKERAWEQIASAGASALSLNAIAKLMGMSGPALYRYFASRDELITELIRDAYRSLADTIQGSVRPDDDVLAPARALRRWALEDPQRYFLVYGTPVPGYHAPDDITMIASEIMAALLEACVAPAPDGPATPLEEHLRERLEGHRPWAEGRHDPPQVLHRALTVWTRLHGVLSLELAGHFNGMGFDPEQLFEAEAHGLLP
ncbi:TetR/AcrR family transcriptional regulator [Streptomyces corynorhini]|uniref:TetR/AcrR family transcriptional regulator n=1 Tax=Streptomyces corynorhini TaxID=2282652 RepID=A0A370B730_9ACTN|nr:TetR/AcrR family transcriptional regulator [Streptomyces corynorhini]RDG37618.1 TetR/AcrR family transcriptional regulator [Streptomyces corynorhini]